MQAVIRRGLASLQSFRADVVVVVAGNFGEVRVSVERTAAGVFKQLHSTPVERAFFSNAREGWTVTYQPPPPEAGRGTARQATNVPLGPPAPPPQFDNIGPDPVGLAREVLGWEEARVTRDGASGRAVWVVQGSTPNRVPELRVVTIDDQTGLALRYDALQAGQPRYQVRVENLATNLDAEPSYGVPAGVPVATDDMGHVRMSLEQAGRSAGLVPLVPTWLPAGFTPAEVTFTTSQARGPRVIAMGFRRGMDLLLMHLTPRSTAPSTPLMTVAMAPGERFDPEGNPYVPPRREQVRISAGALAGVEAERRVADATALSAATDTLFVNIGGDVTVDELMRIAESLQPAR